MCKISLWSIEHILKYSTPKLDQIRIRSKYIEIPLVGQEPDPLEVFTVTLVDDAESPIPRA